MHYRNHMYATCMVVTSNLQQASQHQVLSTHAWVEPHAADPSLVAHVCLAHMSTSIHPKSQQKATKPKTTGHLCRHGSDGPLLLEFTQGTKPNP
jgi:hypothetical protein